MPTILLRRRATSPKPPRRRPEDADGSHPAPTRSIRVRPNIGHVLKTARPGLGRGRSGASRFRSEGVGWRTEARATLVQVTNSASREGFAAEPARPPDASLEDGQAGHRRDVTIRTPRQQRLLERQDRRAHGQIATRRPHSACRNRCRLRSPNSNRGIAMKIIGLRPSQLQSSSRGERTATSRTARAMKRGILPLEFNVNFRPRRAEPPRLRGHRLDHRGDLQARRGICTPRRVLAATRRGPAAFLPPGTKLDIIARQSREERRSRTLTLNEWSARMVVARAV